MELQLISTSSAAGEPADCTLTYRLDKASGHGLPVVHETHPWAGKTICALRDRLMIEWVLSFPESKRLLKMMVGEITSAVKKCNSSGSKSNAGKSKPRSRTLRVGIVCCNGTQLSPSFVEKLYEHFSCGPAIVEGLKVTRHHWDALKGAWGRCKDIVWQVSCIPVRAKLTSHFDDVFNSRMWINFDPVANSTSEQQFRKDPFNSNVDFTDMVLNFESGTAYSSERKKTYFIRCSLVPQSKANYWFLTNDGYKSAHCSFQAAGIQPYSVHPVTGEAVFLLGRITYGTCDWCDFGGLKSSRLRRESPRITAARECYEETLGILGTAQELAAALIDFKTNNCFKVLNVDTQYVGHFLRVPYQDYPSIFETVMARADKYIEVDEMKWFSLSSMKNAVMMAHTERYGISQHSIRVKALREDGSVDHSCSHRLRTPFVSTQCIADALNILDSIAAIARSLHREQNSSESLPKPKEVQDDQDAERSEGKSTSDSTGHADCTSATDTVESKSALLLTKTTQEKSENVGMMKGVHVTATLAEASSSRLTAFDTVTSEQLSAQISSDESSDTCSDSGTESEGPSDDRSTDVQGSSKEQLRQLPSSAGKEAVVTQEETATGKLSPSGNGSKHEAPMSSCVKSKLLSFTSRHKQRRRNRRRVEHKGQHRDSHAQPYATPSKPGKRKLLLYGMGAGSFSVMESYMNS